MLSARLHLVGRLKSLKKGHGLSSNVRHWSLQEHVSGQLADRTLYPHLINGRSYSIDWQSLTQVLGESKVMICIGDGSRLSFLLVIDAPRYEREPIGIWAWCC